jgi:hypothetical protein
MRIATAHVLIATLLLCASCGQETGSAETPDGDPPMLRVDASVSAADAAPDAGLGHEYGEFCARDSDCESSFCYVNACTFTCDIEAPNDCRSVHAFCVPTNQEKHGCYGSIDTGEDLDDAVLPLGVPLTRKLAPAGDADMFHVTLPAGRYRVLVEPTDEVDVRLEVYDHLTKNVHNSDAGGVGVPERALTFVEAGEAGYYLVVRAVGGVPSAFTIRVDAEP